MGLIAVLGKYYALPVLAQTIRAALVASADEEGRVPYRASVILDCNTVDCTGKFPIVPAGKRLVVKHVFSQPALTSSPGQLLLVSLEAPQGTPVFFPTAFQGHTEDGVDCFVVNQAVDIVYLAGETPSFRIVNQQGNINGQQFAVLTGYLLDCSTAPCAAIAP